MPYVQSQIKVLIAERSVSVAEIIARSLRNQGYRIAGIVNSAERAIEFATIAVPDVVLLDLPLPGEIDVFTAGWKILSELHCPVIYMTAQAETLLNQAALLNPHGFLLKPFTANELKTTIDHTLEQYRRQQTYVDQGWDTPGTSIELDRQFLQFLEVASAIQPMPRIFFQQGRLRVYTDTPEAAQILKEHCQHYSTFHPYQIFAWRWEIGEYQLYATAQ